MLTDRPRRGVGRYIRPPTGWLTSTGSTTRAWLVHLLFSADPRAPTTPEEWETAIATADAELGLPRTVPRAGHLILKAGHRDELLDA